MSLKQYVQAKASKVKRIIYEETILYESSHILLFVKVLLMGLFLPMCREGGGP